MASMTERKIYAFKSDDAANILGMGYKLGSDNKHVTKVTAVTDKAYGICQTEAGQVLAAEDVMEIAVMGGGAKLKLAGTVAAGDELTCNATGFVTAASGNWVLAHADQAGVAGDLISGIVCGYFKV